MPRPASTDAANNGTIESINPETAARLKSIVERVENIEEEVKGLKNDIKDIFAEAKSAGFDIKVIRQVLRLLRQEAADRESELSLVEIYLAAVSD